MLRGIKFHDNFSTGGNPESSTPACSEESSALHLISYFWKRALVTGDDCRVSARFFAVNYSQYSTMFEKYVTG